MDFILETPRLIMRPLEIEDLEILHKIDSNPNVHEYLWNAPATDINQTKFVINSILSQYIKHNIGRYGIILKETNEFIGWGGLKFNENTVNNNQNFYDIGICITQEHWNKKLGFEVFQAWIKYAFRNLNLPKLYAYTQTKNDSSNRMAEKIQMRKTNEFLYDDQNWNWYELGILKYDMIINKGIIKDIEINILPILKNDYE
ncbi:MULTISPECIES: GNAT family N-acetyltransferase [Flavobacterium]|uniref:GNAT family N-acetyltransferase n=1 Tax=Flavobacterium covae TaxID=2906076 RepID=A0ABW8PG68_9FLAO|nr:MULTISPECIES: GNAT family N-acetyltransferase [Flavobacterium]OXA72897.1 hypothetical protein B0A56_13565 [Flavobacterium columnare NBRC 100251 = ATCC 23463]MCJ1807146.1 GNAT family N-acetyltransferase [Flavobacterium covae]MCJ1810118.1 GNAT family N-acetyltransferase [Flavobacterium covae]OWP80363.1 hypothetical protein BWK63_11390 [Flavobacterium covae]OWP86446.1 hypothetical protein BWK60_08750 [Flavobacterium covae]